MAPGHQWEIQGGQLTSPTDGQASPQPCFPFAICSLPRPSSDLPGTLRHGCTQLPAPLPCTNPVRRHIPALRAAWGSPTFPSALLPLRFTSPSSPTLSSSSLCGDSVDPAVHSRLPRPLKVKFKFLPHPPCPSHHPSCMLSAGHFLADLNPQFSFRPWDRETCDPPLSTFWLK